MNSPLFRTLCIISALGLSGIVLGAEQLYTAQPSVTPELANPGEYPVGVSTITIGGDAGSESNERRLVLEVWYPAASTDDQAVPLATYKNVTRSHREFELQGTSFRDVEARRSPQGYPLIVVSHGYTGYRTIMFYLGEHLASHGYVVAAIDHTDSTNAEVDMVNAPGAGFISTLLNRAKDQQLTLQHFADSNSPIAAITDTEHAAVIGYSMGGYGAINTVGACYQFTSESLIPLGANAEQAAALMPMLNFCNAGQEQVDPRWRAMIAISPWGGELNLHSPESMAKISTPSLYIVGDQDDISGFEHGVKKLFEQSGAAQSYLMVYENARHNVAAHPAPTTAFGSDLDIGHHFEPSWDLETINRVNRHMSLAFLNCYVKDSAAACDYLPKREDITQKKGADQKLTPAWPGFQERWGTGIRFHRKTQP
ncbi:MAG: acetylhydrolase [Halioglobus sp.]